MGLVRPGADGTADIGRPAAASGHLDVRGQAARQGHRRGVPAVRLAWRRISRPRCGRRRAACPPGSASPTSPSCGCPTATPVAVEALARWIAPNGTQIPPETFVAAAEAAGLGAALDAMVLDLACARGRGRLDSDLVLHVNIGAARLGSRPSSGTCARRWHGTGWRRAGWSWRSPRRCRSWISPTPPREISRLNALGVRVALDDFGAGYNSLTYLHALPVQIDQARPQPGGRRRARPGS